MVYRLIQPRDRVQADQSLCQAEIDKATVEIPSPFHGVIKELLVQEGGIAKVGEGLCVMEVEEHVVEGSELAPVEPVPVEPVPVEPVPVEPIVPSRKVLHTVNLPDIGEDKVEAIRWCVCSGRTFHIALNLTD
jgi:pyruvate/2-oxoglutarate dehydrogenase complex dihydrolipoamide acyltransferase (E2) component